jgi:hypothetical protein
MYETPFFLIDHDRPAMHILYQRSFVLQELREEFDKQNPPYILAVGLSGYKEIINEAYDVLRLSESTDFLTVTTYDYHGAWENRTGHPSPLYSDVSDAHPDYSTVSFTVGLRESENEEARLTAYCDFSAFDHDVSCDERSGPQETGNGSSIIRSKFHIGRQFSARYRRRSYRTGRAGRIHSTAGNFIVLRNLHSKYTIKLRLDTKVSSQLDRYANFLILTATKRGWQIGRNTQTGTDSYAFKDNQWVGYDDRITLRKKASILLYWRQCYTYLLNIKCL